MAFIDYYKILGVPRDIPQGEVREAYRKRAKQFHPDLHPGDPKAKAKFQALSEAYDVIGDAEKRRKYDQYGHQWKQAEAWGGQPGAGQGGGSPFDGFDFKGGAGGFSSFFEELFGRMRNPGTQGRGAGGDTEATVELDLYTALLGGEVVIETGGGDRLKLKVKEGTPNGAKVRLRGKGAGGGDLIITYSVALPSRLNSRQKELLMQMKAAG